MNIQRILRWAAILIGAVVFLLYIVFPIGMGVAAVLPARSTVGPAPDGFQELALSTQDGQTLAAWYKAPSNGAVIVLAHGAGGSREELRPYADLFARHGYGVLALDLRGHGASSGQTNRLGWSSTPDVVAAVQYLQSQAEVRQIGGLGLSMGAEVLLGASADLPSLQAIAADGATRRSLEEQMALPAERSLVNSFTPRVMYAAVQVLSGEQPPKPPLLEAMTAASSTRFLWIAAGTKPLEVEFNTLFAQAVGGHGSLWVVPDAAHTGAFSRYPAEYEQRVIEFFDQALLGN